MKSYRIVKYGSHNKKGETTCYVTSKKKAVEYIKSCLGVLVIGNNWKCSNDKGFRYNDMRCLSTKEILKWRYHGKTCFDNYYVEEIEIL